MTMNHIFHPVNPTALAYAGHIRLKVIMCV